MSPLDYTKILVTSYIAFAACYSLTFWTTCDRDLQHNSLNETIPDLSGLLNLNEVWATRSSISLLTVGLWFQCFQTIQWHYIWPSCLLWIQFQQSFFIFILGCCFVIFCQVLEWQCTHRTTHRCFPKSRSQHLDEQYNDRTSDLGFVLKSTRGCLQHFNYRWKFPAYSAIVSGSILYTFMIPKYGSWKNSKSHSCHLKLVLQMRIIAHANVNYV
jgi:hypothetical protein